MSTPTAERRDGEDNPGPTSQSSAWLVGPWFDIFCIANIAWPLVVWVCLTEGFDGRMGIQFWQLYYVTTPHRWITLVIVFLDRDRFRQRRTAFLLVAAC